MSTFATLLCGSVQVASWSDTLYHTLMAGSESCLASRANARALLQVLSGAATLLHEYKSIVPLLLEEVGEGAALRQTLQSLHADLEEVMGGHTTHRVSHV